MRIPLAVLPDLFANGSSDPDACTVAVYRVDGRSTERLSGMPDRYGDRRNWRGQARQILAAA